VSLAAGEKRCLIVSITPLELWTRIGLNTAHYMGVLSQVISNFVVSVQNNRLI
jgi:hypothetical protein